MRIFGFVAALAASIMGVAAPAAKPPEKPVVTIPPLTPDNTLLIDLSTGGRVTIQLRPDKAPLSVERIKTLAREGFYDGLIFHRVIEGFMAQTGDPQGTGQGGSSLPNLKPEFNDLPHVRGTMSMARADAKDSANSQFFIMLSPNLKLDGKYSPVGRVIDGMAYVDAVARGEPPANPSKIVKMWVASDPERPVHVNVPGAVTPGPSAANAAAAAAAAQAAAEQAAQASVAADDASKAAASGDSKQAAARAGDAAVSAAGAAGAADDAAKAARQAGAPGLLGDDTVTAPAPAPAPEPAPASPPR